MRPFSTLGVRPFLWATPAELRELQQRFYELSRELHPDRFANVAEDARQEAETRSAMLNADYAKLKDFWKLADAVANTAQVAAGAEAPRSGTPPPELASDYFELQEQAAELGPRDAGVLTQAAALKTALETRLREDEARVEQFAQRYPYCGRGNAEAPWTEADLADLRRLLQAVRFGRSFLRDLDAKFPSR